MLCEKCGTNTATTHIHRVVNGVSEIWNLCPACAAEQGFASWPGTGLSSLLASMFGDSLRVQPEQARQKRCRTCGASFSDIAASGRVGCADCYKTFAAEIMPSVQRLHGRAKHAGKVPGSASPALRLKAQTAHLKQALDAAVAAEDFEKAAALRDQIREMEGKAKDND